MMINFNKPMLTALICLILGVFAGILPSAVAAEKKSAPSRQEACGTVTILADKDYFPALIKIIDNAREEIFISIFSFKAGVHKNSYPDKLAAHLGRAAKRGVAVNVILEMSGRTSEELDVQNRRTKKLLEDRGVIVYLDSPRKKTHTKLVVVDRRLVILGSHNFTQSAFKYNNEISVLMERPDLAAQARNYMLEIIRDAK